MTKTLGPCDVSPTVVVKTAVHRRNIACPQSSGVSSSSRGRAAILSASIGQKCCGGGFRKLFGGIVTLKTTLPPKTFRDCVENRKQQFPTEPPGTRLCKTLPGRLPIQVYPTHHHATHDHVLMSNLLMCALSSTYHLLFCNAMINHPTDSLPRPQPFDPIGFLVAAKEGEGDSLGALLVW